MIINPKNLYAKRRDNSKRDGRGNVDSDDRIIISFGVYCDLRIYSGNSVDQLKRVKVMRGHSPPPLLMNSFNADSVTRHSLPALNPRSFPSLIHRIIVRCGSLLFTLRMSTISSIVWIGSTIALSVVMMLDTNCGLLLLVVTLHLSGMMRVSGNQMSDDERVQRR